MGEEEEEVSAADDGTWLLIARNGVSKLEKVNFCKNLTFWELH